MELGAAGLQQQPFRTGGKPLVMSSYAAQQSALEFLKKTYKHKHGLGLLQGPSLSGKSTVIRHFIDIVGDDVSTAIVDAHGITTQTLLESVLGQFGYQLELTSVNELLNMLRVFAMQQTVAGQAPLLVIENTHTMNANALGVLSELADVKASRQSAVRVVLSSDRSIDHIIDAPAMEGVAARVTDTHRLGAMTLPETRAYLHAKLSAAGSVDPAGVIPDEVCDHLYSASGGWPGVVDQLALIALIKAEKCPISSKHVDKTALTDIPEEIPASAEIVASDVEEANDDTPRLYLTLNGRTLGAFALDNGRLIIGRSEHNDMRINSNFVSRHHAMFVRRGSATLLMDLNSTNGTFVNSRRVSNYVMMHDDVISIGNHRVKFVHPAADSSAEQEQDGIADTVIMKTLEDMRRLLAKESTQTMPMEAIIRAAASEPDK